MRIKLALLLALILPGVASADIRPDWNLAKNYERDGLTDLYLGGAIGGLEAANVHLVMAGRKPLYCLHEKLSINIQNVITIFESELEFMKSADMSSLPEWEYAALEDVLIFGLKRTFPCDK